MSSYRKSISLSPDEERLLRTMYYEAQIPTDQFPKRQREWSRFTAVWNQATGRNDSKEELLHWMVTRRKRGKDRPGRLEAIGPEHQRLRSPGTSMLSSEQLEVLDQVYQDLRVASDNFVFDRDLAKDLAREFAERTGEGFSATALVAALIARRKDGFLGRLGPDGGPGEERDIGFGDIDQVA